ncbi:hypothetical protein CSOJ01_07966 [Colletotrichum sojae]|uniref:CorA-like transporter domain-containing protein n=1 Tax=Colletotrichum sojae TaxID=2175907 RepID=A0A8H6J735_9PEZI|nr:hypothetical protein CSOJ01_07966 [Colletotrichum sojae]
MFQLICNHQQIDSSFLESLCSFGYQDEPIDLCLAHFRGKIGNKINGPDLSPSSLTRPERQIQLSYLLRSVERGGNTDRGIWDWNIRQAANYHSFDLKTGKSFWATIKANDLLRKRVERFTPLLNIQPEPENESQEPLASHLKAALCTHLVLLSWCDDGWRDFINDFEAAVEKIVRPANNAMVDDHLPEDKGFQHLGAWPEALRPAKRITIQSYQAKGGLGTDNQQKESFFSMSRLPRALGSLLGASKKVATDEEQGMPLDALSTAKSTAEAVIDPRGSLSKFRFKDIQTLYKQSNLLQRALLVLDLNAGVMRDLQACYGQLAKVELTAAAFGPVIGGFLTEVTSIIRRLETRRTQLNALATMLSQSIQLYELVLQQRSDHINVTFAESAHKATDQMKRLADKTSRETASMHIITGVTLIFLPATFVATFFQSGIFLWKEAPDDMEEAWKYQGAGLSLFCKVCAPLTLVTIGGWYLSWRMGRRKGSHKD